LLEPERAPAARAAALAHIPEPAPAGGAAVHLPVDNDSGDRRERDHPAHLPRNAQDVKMTIDRKSDRRKHAEGEHEPGDLSPPSHLGPESRIVHHFADGTTVTRASGGTSSKAGRTRR